MIVTVGSAVVVEASVILTVRVVYVPSNFGKGPLRLVALIKSADVAKKILTAMRLPAEVPELHPVLCGNSVAFVQG